MTPETFQLTNHNPLRSLDEARLVSMLEAGERGQYAELQWLFRFVEKRDPICRAVKSRLLASIGKLQWQIKAPDCGADAPRQAMAKAQQETLRAEYDRITNLADALKFLALAELRGFAHLEKIYEGSQPLPPVTSHQSPVTSDPWAIVELRIVEQWFWVRRGIYGAWQYNDGAKMSAITGADVDPKRFVIREIDGAIGEIAAKLYVWKDNNDADWDGAIETFGVPPVIIEMPPNVSPEKEAEFKAAAENVASGAKGVIPSGAKVHTINPLSGSGVFKERLEYLEAQLVIAATAGKLTILTESGSGTLAGQAQADAFAEIAETIAAGISGVMQDQLDQEILARKHSGEPPLAYFELSRSTEKDGSKALGDAKLAKEAGFELDADQLSENSGYKLTKIAAPAPPVQPPPVQAAAQTPDELQHATAAALGVSPEYLAPAAQEFGTLLAEASDGSLTPDALLASAQALLDRLPDLAAKMDTTAIADTLAQAMRSAVASTVRA